MNKKCFRLLMVLIVTSLLAACTVAAAGAPRISKEELKSRLDDKNVVIIDVRTVYDWEKSDSKIKGAIREYPQDIGTWAKKYPKEKTIVLYCA